MIGFVKNAVAGSNSLTFWFITDLYYFYLLFFCFQAWHLALNPMMRPDEGHRIQPVKLDLTRNVDFIVSLNVH